MENAEYEMATGRNYQIPYLGRPQDLSHSGSRIAELECPVLVAAAARNRAYIDLVSVILAGFQDAFGIVPVVIVICDRRNDHHREIPVYLGAIGMQIAQAGELEILSGLGKPKRAVMLEPSPELLDVLWGYYFATGSYGAVMQIIAMLPWSDDHDDTERLTIGSMAKFTLATNAIRDQALLAMLKSSSKARNQPEKTVLALNEVTEAAETVDTAQIRKQAVAALDELKSKGPAYKRAANWWLFVGQSAIAGGCIAAAVSGHIELGLPCVVGVQARYLTTRTPLVSWWKSSKKL